MYESNVWIQKFTDVVTRDQNDVDKMMLTSVSFLWVISVFLPPWRAPFVMTARWRHNYTAHRKIHIAARKGNIL
jgi:hypothetical protein